MMIEAKMMKVFLHN